MNTEKQIEEMAKDICEICRPYTKCTTDAECIMANVEAEKLVAKGYRKASEVAREISQDIIEPLWNAYKKSTCQETVLLVALICETINYQLKKKYTEERK